MIKLAKSWLDEDGTVKARMEDFPPEAFQMVYGPKGDEKRKLVAISRKCLNYRANALTEIPFQFEKGELVLFSSEEKEISPGYRDLKLLVDLLRPIEISLIRWGKCYVHIDDMRLLFAPHTEIKTDKETGEITSYVQTIGTKEIQYNADEIIYIHETSDEEGKPIEPILDTVGFDTETLCNIDNYISSYFKNGAIKTTLLTVDGYPVKEETDRLESHLNKVTKGVKNAFKNIVLRLPITPVVIGSGLEDFKPELSNNKILDIVTAFEIPPSLVLANAANYATALSDKKEFYSSVISPRCRLIAIAVNEQWLSDFGISLVFMPEKHSVMRVDETVRSQSLMNLVGAGFDLMTAVEVLGYDLTEEQKSRLMETEKKRQEQSSKVVSQVDTQEQDQNSGDIIVTKSYSIY